MTTFDVRLRPLLSLTIGGKKWALQAASLESLELELSSFGFSGRVEFVRIDDNAADADNFLTQFKKTDLMQVDLTLDVAQDDPEAKTSLKPLVLTGLVRERQLVEVPTLRAGGISLDQRPIHQRRFRVEFADPASVLWKQHFPTVLYTQKSLADILKEHTGTRISLSCDGEVFTRVLPQFFVHLPREYGVSFYDFLWWVLGRNGAWLQFDYTKKQYSVSHVVLLAPTAESIVALDIGELSEFYPELARHDVRVLNSYTEAVRSQTVTNSISERPVVHDRLLDTEIAQDVDQQVTREQDALTQEPSRVQMTYQRYPTSSFWPGTKLAFSTRGLWSSNRNVLPVEWRVDTVELRAERVETQTREDIDGVTWGARLALRSRLRQASQDATETPPVRAPSYPGYVEGKVVSDEGEATQKTYQILQDTDTSLWRYRVKVPLWEDQIVFVPHQPLFAPGNVYIPWYRDERVLLALFLDSAQVQRTLDWREGVRLPGTSQGEQLWFGKAAKDHTALSHTYVESNPVFSIARVHEKDQGTLTIQEGKMLLDIEEASEGGARTTLVCTVELDKQKGITLQVENESKKISQTCVFDGESITTTVRGEQATSRIVQKSGSLDVSADAVSFQCKTFQVKASETIQCSSQQASKYEADAGLEVRASGNLDVQTDAQLTMKSTSSCAIESSTSLSAKAGTQMSLKGLEWSAQGDTSAKLKAPQVEIAADAQLKAASNGIASVEGSMTTVKGQLVTLG